VSTLFLTVSIINSVATLKAKTEFFGALLPSQWEWFGKHGGWTGVAALARGLSTEVGALEWRTEGLVALMAAADSSKGNVTVLTKPVMLWEDGVAAGHSAGARTGADADAARIGGANSSGCNQLVATINCNCSGGVTVELWSGEEGGGPIAGYAGINAAIVHPFTNSVAIPLTFGGSGNDAIKDGGAGSAGTSSSLPPQARSAPGVRFRVEWTSAGSQLYGISLRCQTTAGV
jgi:hypothetical protein